MSTSNAKDELLPQVYLSLQKILRTLDLGRSLRGKTPSITVAQMQVLSFFNERDVVHISEISRSLGKSIASINNIIRRLQDAGYVAKSKNSHNRRFSDIRLTPLGKKRFKSFRVTQENTLSQIFDRLKPDEKEQVRAALSTAAGILERASLDT